MKKLFNLVCVAFLSVVIMVSGFSFSSITVSAEEEENWPSGPQVVAESAILIEATTGAVLYNKNMNQQMYPASITKILTALVALENSSLDDSVVFSYTSASSSLEEGAANIGINEGESLTMEDALYALLLHSANDVANGIAENVGGSTTKFVTMMNKRAKEAGALNSNFVNPSGLFDENHYTTAYDMAMIMRECIKNSTFDKIDGTTTYTIGGSNFSGGPLEVVNRNKMLIPGNPYYYEGVIGGKTGYLQKSGRTLITVARRNNMTLISVILNTTTESQFTDATMLLDYGFNNFNLLNISENETHFSSSGSGFLSSAGSIFDSHKSSEIYISPKDNVVLPKNISFSDTDPLLKVIKNRIDNSLATIEYSYLGNYVGKTTLKVKDLSSSSETSPFINKEASNDSLGLDWQLRINIWYVILAGFLIIVFLLIRRNLNLSIFTDALKRKGQIQKKKSRSKKRRRLHF